jgi:hypothetical protein
MNNQRKLHVVMDLLNEVILRRGQDASTDRIGEGIATAMGNLVLACARMSVEGQADGDQPDDFDDEPHGSRDTFVPHPDGPDAERFNPLQD